eukprot:s171_g2.t1
MSKAREAKSKGMSEAKDGQKPRDVKSKGCQKPKDVESTGFESREMLFVRQAIQAKCAQVPRSFMDFEHLTQEKGQQVQELRSGFVEIFVANLEELSSEVDLFVSEEKVLDPDLLQLSENFGSGFGEGKDEVEDKLNQLSKLEKHLNELQERHDTYVHYQEVIRAKEITPEQLPDLSNAWLQMQRRLDVWWTFDDWQRKCNEWLPADLLGVDLMEVATEVTALSTRASQAQEDLPENPVAQELGRQLLYIQDLIPVLEVLQNPHLRTRHWTALSQVMLDLAVGKDGKPHITFGQAANWNLGASLPELLAIARRATQEHYVEVALEKLKETWSGLELPIVASNGSNERDTLAVDSLQSLWEELEDGVAVVGAALSSSYAEVHADRLKLWQARFEKVQELLDEIWACQQCWIYLDETLSVVENSKKIAEVAAFQQVDSTWKALLQPLQLRPNIVEIALDPQSSQSFRHLHEAMENIKKDLHNFLETKRPGYSGRLCLLSDSQLLKLLGTRSDQTVEHFLRLCFPGVDAFEHLDREIFALRGHSLGRETERLMLSTRVKLRNNAEETLEAIQTVMVAAMRQSIKVAVEQAGSHVAGATAWAVDSELPSQVVLIAWETLWLVSLQESWSANAMDGVKEHLQRWHSILQLRLLQRAARGSSGSSKCDRAALLLLAFQHKQSYLEELLHARADGDALESFAFQKDLRYEYLSDSGGKVMVSLLKAQFPHGLEYLPIQRLVITPQSERCWIALTQALRLQMGALLQGSGKTELSRGLATAFGLGFISYRCCRGSTTLATQLVAGCAQGGCWLQLDALNLMRPDVLGTLALHLRRLQEALRAKRETVDLQGTSLPLKPSAMIFATLHSIDRPLSSFESLACLQNLRPVTLPALDVLPLVEGLLLSEGFNEEPELARKVASFWKHWAALEGKELGLRLLREVISKAGALRRRVFETTTSAVELVESEIMAETLEVTLKHRFGDSTLTATTALFFERCELHLESAADARGTGDTLQRRLEESLTSHRGLVLLGPAASGKSHLLTEFKDSLNKAPSDAGEVMQKAATLNPELQKLPAMTAVRTWHGKAKMETLSEGSGEDSEKKEAVEIHRIYAGTWSFTELFSKKGPLLQTFQAEPPEPACASCEKGVGSFVCFDGPLDPLWSEHLHLALDDAIFALPDSVERMPLRQDLKFIFECDELSRASPAFLTRCALLCLPEVELPVLQRRMMEHLDLFRDALEESDLAYLKGLAETQLPDAVAFWQELQEEKLRVFFQTLSELLMDLLASCAQALQLASCKDFLLATWTLALAWSLGSVVDAAKHSEISSWCLQRMKQLPEAQLYRQNLFHTRLDATAPHLRPFDLDVVVPLPYNMTRIPTLESEAMLWLMNIRLSSHNTLITGTCGKTMLAQEFVSQVARSGSTVADLRVGRRSVSSNIFQKALELELRRDTEVDALGSVPPGAPQRTGSGSLALVPTGAAGTAGTGTGTAVGSPMHRLPSRSATVATSSAATAGFGLGQRRSETFQSDDLRDLRWDRTVSLESGEHGSRVRLVVDDLALAPKTKTGVRPVLEFLRQLLETGQLYDRSSWSSQQLEPTLTACAEVDSAICGRLRRHMGLRLRLAEWNKTSLLDLYGNLVDTVHQETMQRQVSSSAAHLVAAHALGATVTVSCIRNTLEIYDFVTQNFKRSWKSPSYVWSLRDIGRVMQGITLALENPSFATADLHRLWIHEVSRVFEDQLQMSIHRQLFQATVRDLVEDFGVKWKPEDNSLRFIKRLSGSVAKPYEKANEEAMLKTMQDCLEETRHPNSELTGTASTGKDFCVFY